MATMLTLVIAGDEPGTSKKVYVAETFDDVIDKIFPTTSPTTALEARGRRVFEKSDGSGRVLIPEGNIAWISENEDDG